MKKLSFDIRDIFATPRIALSGKKIWVQLLGLVAGWLIYTILTYIGLLANGQSIVEIWNQHHLFPCLWAGYESVAWYCYLLSGLGIVIWLVIFLLTSTAVARITYKQLKGDEFFSASDSFKYVKKHGVATIMAPVSIILIMAFFIICAFIAAWIAKWPVLDILFLGLPYLLYFVVATFVVYTAVVLLVSLLLAPAIVGTAEEDTMETVFQSYSTLWNQPWRLAIYEALVLVLTGVATFVFGWALILGYKFFNFVFGANFLMGGKMTRMAEWGISFIYGPNSPLTPYIDKFFGTYKFPESVLAPLTVTETITTVLLAIAYFAIAFSVVAYALTNFSVGQALIYIVLRKKKDDENLIERKDEDELKEEEERKKEEEERKKEEESKEETTSTQEGEKPSSETPSETSSEPQNS